MQIRTTGSEMIVEGDAGDVGRAERVLGQLTAMMDEGYKLGKGDVKTAAQLVAEDGEVDLRDHFLKDGQIRTDVLLTPYRLDLLDGRGVAVPGAGDLVEGVALLDGVGVASDRRGGGG